MAVTATPIFPQTPKIGRVTITAANTARDGSGSLNTIFTAGSNGSLVDSVVFHSAPASIGVLSAMVVVLWITDGADANIVKVAEAALATSTSSNTAVCGSVTFNFLQGVIAPANTVAIGITAPLPIPAGFKLKATITVHASSADDIQVLALYGDY